MYKYLSSTASALVSFLTTRAKDPTPEKNVSADLNKNDFFIKSNVLKSSYPIGTLYDSGQLQVSNNASIYYEQRGNPNGPVVIYNHGGPGGSSAPDNSQWFDPDYYRIIIYDQRGTGKSIPSISNREINSDYFKDLTIDDMVSDLEKLRNHLAIPQWIIFGGSWGSTLSLAYSEAHPEKVAGLIVYGIFLNQSEEMDQYFNLNIFKQRFPELGEKALTILHQYASSQGYQIDPLDAHQFIDAYYELCVLKNDSIAQFLWSEFENFNDSPTEESLDVLNQRPDKNHISSSDRTHAVFENIIFKLSYKGFNILDSVLLSKLKNINIHIIQGLEDTEAPPIFAKKLVDALLPIIPNLNYKWIKDGKHDSNSSTKMTEALIESVDSFKKMRK